MDLSHILKKTKRCGGGALPPILRITIEEEEGRRPFGRRRHGATNRREPGRGRREKGQEDYSSGRGRHRVTENLRRRSVRHVDKKSRNRNTAW